MNQVNPYITFIVLTCLGFAAAFPLWSLFCRRIGVFSVFFLFSTLSLSLFYALGGLFFLAAFEALLVLIILRLIYLTDKRYPEIKHASLQKDRPFQLFEISILEFAVLSIVLIGFSLFGTLVLRDIMNGLSTSSTSDSVLFVSCITFFFFGLLNLLFRRNLISVFTGLLLIFQGSGLVFSTIITIEDTATLISQGEILSVFAVIMAMATLLIGWHASFSLFKTHKTFGTECLRNFRG